MLDAFKAADQVLLSGVQGITDLITTPGLINLDFADVKSVMSGAGSALMGIGSSRGDDRAIAAAEMAISSPLLEASIDGAHGVLLSIQGGSDLGLFEINEAAQLVSNSAATDANIIFGAVIDDALGDEVRVTVIAAGFDEPRTSIGMPSTAGVPASGSSDPSSGAGAPGLTSSGVAARGLPASPQKGAPWQPAVTTSPVAPVPHATPVAPTPAPVFAAADAGAVPLLSAPVLDSGAASGPGPLTSTESLMAGAPPVPDASVAGNGSVQPSAASAAAAPEPTPAVAASGARVTHVETGKTFDIPARRRPVVFEEDDDLDIPDFLK